VADHGLRSLAIALSVALIAACGVSPSPSSPSSPAVVTAGPSTAPSVDAAFAGRLMMALEAALADAGAPGAQATIVFADGSLWTGAAGSSTADLPMKPELLMAIGSVTKVYTAALTLDLADDGILSLDDPVTKWVPDAVNADLVIIRQLLLHTSGIASDDPALAPVCRPGTCQSYSNSGYGYLGAVIERATGIDYADALREHILASLGLEATFFPGQEAIDGEPALGHQGDEEALADDAATSGGPGARGASGGIVATAADTARFAHALFSGSLLSRRALDALLDFEATRGLPGTDDCAAEAMVYRRGGEFGESWNHGGNTGFFRSWVEHYPRYGVTIVVNVNSNALPVGLVDRLAHEALADAPILAEPAAWGGECETDVAVRAADGSVRTVTTTRGFDGMPSWSPDGRSLVWVGNHDGQNDIYAGDVLGSGVLQLTDDAAQDVFARWSPDGSAIAFSSDRDGDHEIYLMAPDGNDVRRLTRNDVDDWVPAWSPDGLQIAYVSSDGGRHLRVMAADGTADRRVSGAVDEPWWPTWSPDGTRLAYESGGVIYVIPAAGGDPIRLPIPQIRVTRFPAWAPGTDIAFSSDGDIYATTEDGTNLRRLTETSTTETTPAWSPDGATIAFELSYWTPEANR
jgi:CubicO group peptidase (beta-lactamase class C family)